MSLPPRAVIFDLGKVLLDFDYARAAAALALSSTLTAPEIRHHLDQSPLLLSYESGAMTTSGFIAEVSQRIGFSGSIDTFVHSFADIFTEIPAMVALHMEVHATTPTFIFSNTNEMAVQHVTRAFPFFSRFTGHVLSYEHASMKPEPRIYEIVEKLSGASGSEIVYIDDRLENVEGGRIRGWRTVLHTDPALTRESLRGFGLTLGAAPREQPPLAR
jgi:putative hydrolase of the HAD superfamily